MKPIGIINFNTSAYSKKILDYPDIKTIKLGVTMGDVERKNVKMEEIFSYVDETKEIPKTSLPSTGEIAESYDEMLEKYNYVIVLTPAKELSGTHHNAILAQDLVETSDAVDRIFVIETGSFVFSEAYMCEMVIDEIMAGNDIDQIVSKVGLFGKNFDTYIIPGDLNYLKMSGRVNMTQLLIGKLVSLKLLVRHVPGELPEVVGKARGVKKLFREIGERVKDESNVLVSGILPEASEFQGFKEALHSNKVYICESPILACHFGPGTLGFSIVKE